jgi:hypothetical protein
MTVEETQDYFTRFRMKGQSLRVRDKAFDIDDEFKKILTCISREVDKLMHLTNKPDPLEAKNHEAVVAYAKLVGNLKKQMNDALANSNPDDLEKLADEDRS